VNDHSITIITLLLLSIPPILGCSDSQKDSYKTALVYVNQYALTEKKYPKFRQRTKEHVECFWLGCPRANLDEAKYMAGNEWQTQ
jgi:hypothetical protein